MQKLISFLKQNGLSLFSLLAIIGIVAWVVPQSVLSPGLKPATVSPTALPFNETLVAAASELGLDPQQFKACLESRQYQQLVEASAAEAGTLGIQATPSSIINGTLVIGALPLADFDKAITAENKGSLSSDIAGLPFLGKANAATLIVEYGDYQCGYCRKFHDEILPQLKEKYLDTGKAKFVFKDLVIFGEKSQMIAEAARCAGDQGKFWEYHAKGFTLNSAD